MTRDELRADCARCAALCCVATTFDRSPDFACSKAAGVPCLHLGSHHRCTVHADRVALGFSGCLAYDCYGAGQFVTQALLAGGSWRGRADAPRLFAAFLRLVELHELLATLDLALGLEGAAPLRPALQSQLLHLQALRSGELAQLAALDLRSERRAAEALLVELRALVRRAPSSPGVGGPG
jgi:hypothetical protein